MLLNMIIETLEILMIKEEQVVELMTTIDRGIHKVGIMIEEMIIDNNSKDLLITKDVECI